MESHRNSPADGWNVPRAFGRGIPVGFVLVILAVGAVATVLLYQDEERAVDREERETAARVARSLAGTTDLVIAGLDAASTIVDTGGSIDPARFDRIAGELVSSTVITVLAREVIVDGPEREAFEADAGREITEIGDGGLVRARSRASYVPVVGAAPESDTARALLGFDITSDPVRNAAAEMARDSGEVVFSPPVESQPSGALAFFIIRALYDPSLPIATVDERRVALVGFLSSAIPVAELLETLTEQLPPGARASVDDDGVVLIATDPAPGDGARAQTVRGGRTLTVLLDVADEEHDTARLMALGTIGIALLAGLLLWRNGRQTRELRDAAVNVRALGQLSEQLAIADTLDDVLGIITVQAAPAVGARFSTLALPTSRGEMLNVVSSGTAAHPPGIPVEQPAGSNLLMVQAWQDDAPVLVGDLGEIRRRFPSQANTFAVAALQAAAAFPLTRSDGEVLGVLAWVWPSRQRFRGRLRATLDATAEVCRQSLVRADAQATRQAAGDAMSALGQRLSVVRSLDDVADAVVGLGPAASGADQVAIAFADDGGATMRLVRAESMDDSRARSIDVAIEPSNPLLAVLRDGRRVRLSTAAEIDSVPLLRSQLPPGAEEFVALPLIDSGGQLRGVLGFAFVAPLPLHRRAEISRLASITDLAAQTVERAQLYQQQHDLVIELQRRNLPALPKLAGVRIAARYMPASSSLGLGGDWYDVIALDGGRAGVVVGDVVGHGIDAIADMTEIRTTVSTLMRTGSDLREVAAQATTLIRRELVDGLRFATAVLILVDPAAGSASYYRAGHPPPMLRTPTGEVRTLEGRGGTPIGIDGEPGALETISFDPGSLFVVFTDGLIERRGESIDDGLDRLAHALASAETDDPEELCDRLMVACLEGRSTSDDAALLVIAVP